MKEELFDELVESIREGGALKRSTIIDDIESAYVALLNNDPQKAAQIIVDVIPKAEEIFTVAVAANDFVREGSIFHLSIRTLAVKKVWNRLVMEVMRARYLLE